MQIYENLQGLTVAHLKGIFDREYNNTMNEHISSKQQKKKKKNLVIFPVFPKGNCFFPQELLH